MNSPRLLDVHFRSRFGNEKRFAWLDDTFRVLSFFLVTLGIRSNWEGWLHNLVFPGGVVFGLLLTRIIHHEGLAGDVVWSGVVHSHVSFLGAFRPHSKTISTHLITDCFASSPFCTFSPFIELVCVLMLLRCVYCSIFICEKHFVWLHTRGSNYSWLGS